jgi:hypothetical protein
MKRFSELVTRQLDAFAEDGMLDEVHEMKTKYDRVGRDEAEEAFGDYMDVVDAVKDALVDMRNHYAGSLDADAAEEYESVFDRAAQKRWRWLG